LAASHRLRIGIGIGIGQIQVESGGGELEAACQTVLQLFRNCLSCKCNFLQFHLGGGGGEVGAIASWQLAWVRTWTHPHDIFRHKSTKMSEQNKKRAK